MIADAEVVSRKKNQPVRITCGEPA